MSGHWDGAFWVVEEERKVDDSLMRVLREAWAQAMNGKGDERHANGEPFERQPIITITEAVGLGFPLGQAIKKTQESVRLLENYGPARARAELLGAINYLAAACLVLETPPGKEAPSEVEGA